MSLYEYVVRGASFSSMLSGNDWCKVFRASYPGGVIPGNVTRTFRGFRTRLNPVASRKERTSL